MSTNLDAVCAPSKKIRSLINHVLAKNKCTEEEREVFLSDYAEDSVIQRMEEVLHDRGEEEVLKEILDLFHSAQLQDRLHG